MRSSLLVVAFLLSVTTAFAQHSHFIYLQADNKQPFYVKVNGNLYSSSGSGYLIIPKLQAGTHELSIGFPKNQWPAQNIPVTISGKDLGYLLKNFDSKGWGLFNIQTMDVIMPAAGNTTAAAGTTKTETKTDEFSNALADVVNTPSIKEVQKEIPKEDKKPEAPKKEEAMAVVPVVNKTETPVVSEKKPSSIIKKIKTSQAGESTNITYLVTDEYGSDTIEISIPQEKAVEAAVSQQVEVKSETAKPTVTVKQPEPKFIDIELPKTEKTSEKTVADKTPVKDPDVTDPLVAAVDPGAMAPLQMVNSDCKSVATDEDFMKARKKMTAQKSDEEMVAAAKKLFRQKCYSTAQVKNLSVLFLKDEGKYQFFDAVYPFVYDSGEFKSLESQLSEEYYKSRFRSMIRN